VIRANGKSRNQQRLRLYFLRVQVLGNTLTHYIFSVTFDSKTDSKTGRQQWISVDGSGHSIGFWSGWNTSVDGKKQVMPKGGLSLSCSLVFANVHVVLESSIFCSLNVVIFADVRRRCCMGCCTAYGDLQKIYLW